MTEKMILDKVPIGSTAFEAGLRGGEEIISLNGNSDFELIDFIYSTLDDEIILEVKSDNSNSRKYKIVREGESQPGLSLSSYPMRTCRNKCIFCYIDQLPENLRETLYIKDDDYQLSFLKGSYISFSNFSSDDIEKVKKYSLSPLYISLHATNRKLRNKMMGNVKLDAPLCIVKELAAHRISMHFQVVLCPGINDGNELEKTIQDVAEYYPHASSIAIIPASSTRFRKNPDLIKGIDSEYSKSLIERIKVLQDKYYQEFEEYFVYLSDEFYLSAGLDFPGDDEYFDYPQIENGVGISRKFLTEFEESLEEIISSGKKPTVKSCSIITSKLALNIMNRVAIKLKELFDIDMKICSVENSFLGSSITVAGLLAGCDIIDYIKKSDLPEPVIIPDVIFSDACSRTLDNMTQDIVRSSTGMDIIYVSPTTAQQLVKSLF